MIVTTEHFIFVFLLHFFKFSLEHFFIRLSQIASADDINLVFFRAKYYLQDCFEFFNFLIQF